MVMWNATSTGVSMMIPPLWSKRVLDDEEEDRRLYRPTALPGLERVFGAGVGSVAPSVGFSSPLKLRLLSSSWSLMTSSSMSSRVSRRSSERSRLEGGRGSRFGALVKDSWVVGSSVGKGSSSKSRSAQVLRSLSAQELRWAMASEGIGSAIYLSRDMTLVDLSEYIL